MPKIVTNRDNPRLQAALEYKNMFGFSVIPVDENKKPHIRWQEFQRRRASDEEVKEWFRRWPNANIGIVTGHLSNLMVVDTDGEKSTQVVKAMLPQSFNCPLVKSPSGGEHFYFKYDASIKNKNGVFPECDIKAAGGYVLAPPSMGAGGAVYEWLVGLTNSEIPEIPQDLRDFLFAFLRLEGNQQRLQPGFLIQGRRDEDLFHISNVLKQYGMERARVERIIVRLAAICTPPFDRNEALRKVESAFNRTSIQGIGVQSPVLRNLSEISPQQVRWLWPNRIPMGSLTLLVGNPGLGKSILSIDIAAHVTSGTTWPDCDTAPPSGSVILLTAEDGLADTVRVRADAAGADVRKITILDGVRTPTGGEIGVSLDRHMEMLEQAIRDVPNVVLIIIDPITAYLGRTQDKNTELRSVVFTPLAKLAEQHMAAILAITHFNKNQFTENSLHRILGSTAFAAAPRSVLAVINDERGETPSRRLLKPIKMNLSKDSSALAFTIIQDANGKPKVAYNIAPIRPGNEEHTSVLEEAVGMLRELLRNGRVESNVVWENAMQRGISRMTLRRAKQKLGVRTFKGNSQDGFKWFYELPS